MSFGELAIERIDGALEESDHIQELEENGHFSMDEKIDQLRLVAEIENFDKYSILLKKVELHNSKTADMGKHISDHLRKRAQFLADKIKYLLEDLALIEMDEVNHKAQLRSVRPDKQDEMTSYFDLVLHGNAKITFMRYQYNNDAKDRTPISFSLTKEILQRLLDDLAESFQQ